MRHTDRFRSLIAALAVGAIAAAASAQDTSTGEVGESWRASFNKNVVDNDHWRFTLHYVERDGDRLAVGLSYKNTASTGRPMFLDADFMNKIALVDVATEKRYALIEVEGVSPEITAVKRRETRHARFVFTFPEGASAVTFTSQWISMRMAGAVAVTDVEFDIAIPPPEARPI